MAVNKVTVPRKKENFWDVQLMKWFMYWKQQTSYYGMVSSFYIDLRFHTVSCLSKLISVLVWYGVPCSGFLMGEDPAKYQETPILLELLLTCEWVYSKADNFKNDIVVYAQHVQPQGSSDETFLKWFSAFSRKCTVEKFCCVHRTSS